MPIAISKLLLLNQIIVLNPTFVGVNIFQIPNVAGIHNIKIERNWHRDFLTFQEVGSHGNCVSFSDIIAGKNIGKTFSAGFVIDQFDHRQSPISIEFQDVTFCVIFKILYHHKFFAFEVVVAGIFHFFSFLLDLFKDFVDAGKVLRIKINR